MKKLLALLLLAGSAFGQGEKISQMPAATLPLTGTELVPMVQNGANVATPSVNLGTAGLIITCAKLPVLTGAITSSGCVTTYTGIVPIANGGTGQGSPSLLGGTNVTISGTWPNQTISSTYGQVLPIGNGGTGTNAPGLIAGTNVTISGSWPNQTIASSGGGSGSGTVNSGTLGQIAYYASAGTAVSGTSTFSVSSITGGTANTTGINLSGYIVGQGLVNACNFSTVANGGSGYCGNTVRNLEALSCANSSGATQVTISEDLHLAPYATSGARGVVSGCGPIAAQNFKGGIVTGGAPAGYAVGDYIIASGGTPTGVTVNTGLGSATFTGSIAAASGVLNVASGLTGNIDVGQVITGTGISTPIFITGFLGIGTGVGGGTGGTGLYQTNYTGGAVASTAMTATPKAVFLVNQVSPFAVSVVGSGSYSISPPGGASTMGNYAGSATTGTYTSISGTGGTGSGAIGTVVINGAGHVGSITITTPGSAYIFGDTLSFAVTGGTVTGQVQSVFMAQGSTTGGGSGATFAPPLTGLPISGPITVVGVGTFTIGGTAPTITAPGGNNWWAIGNDDAPAINAAFAAGYSGVFLPVTQTQAWATNLTSQYSQFTQLNLPSAREFTFGCMGNSINALEVLNAQLAVAFNPGSGLFFIPANNEIIDCYLEGFGLVNYNIYQGGADWRITSTMDRDATVANIIVGDGSASDNAENNTLLSNTFHNDQTLVPIGASLGFATGSGSSDNQIFGLYGDGCVYACVQTNSAGTSIDIGHVYLSFAGPGYDIEGAKTYLTNVIDDNPPPGTSCYFENAGVGVLNSWECNTSANTNGQIGVKLNVDSTIVVGCGNIGAVGSYWNANTANIVVQSAAFTSNRVAPCVGKQDQIGYFAAFGVPATGGAQTINAIGTQSLTFGNVTDGLFLKIPDCTAACVNAIQLQPTKEGQQAVITVASSSVAQGDLAINVTAASAAAASGLAGGAANLTGGNADNSTASTVGGTANVFGGTGSTNATGGVGGPVNIKGGPGGNNSNGGNVTITGGALAGSGSVGTVNIQTGTTGVTNINTGSNGSLVHLADGTGAGNVIIGNANNQVSIRAPLISGSGTQFTVAGTGACSGATITAGGTQAGRVACPGTTGSATLTFTFVSAPTGWACWASDISTGVTFAQSGTGASSCTMTAAAVTSGNSVVFGALGY